MIITVTAKDIIDGQRFSAHNCPISLALSRYFGKIIPVTATYAIINSHFVRLPQTVTTFVLKYQAYQDVRPFTFELEL